MAEFEDFVRRHGESGGWDREDHDEFVRVVKGCGGDYVAAVAVCMERVIGFSRPEVMEHARWHMDYMDLLVRKRVALAKWREGREKERAKHRAQAALLDSETAMQVRGRGAGMCQLCGRGAGVRGLPLIFAELLICVLLRPRRSIIAIS